MNKFINNPEGNLKTPFGETLNYRIYSDGSVKIEGNNMRMYFVNIDADFNYINSNNIRFL